jgi:long-chain acyl-CoA synthetase
MFERVHYTALALQALNLAKGDRVALLSENRLEWAVADLAIQSAGYITVPIHTPLPNDQVAYILQDCEARAAFVSNEKQLAKVRACRPDLPKLLHVFSFDPCDADTAIPMEALIERGRMVETKTPFVEMISTVGKVDWASIIYTSGTTGTPKGVVLTQRNFVSNVEMCLDAFEVTPNDVCLSFLPLSHVFERTGGFYVMLHAGATIAYAESIETLGDDMRAISPSVMNGAPRVYEKMYARIMDSVESSSGMRQNLFRWAMRAGQKYLTEKLEGGAGVLTRGKHSLANALVFKRLRSRTGGKLRFFISGGAPLAREIAEFFNAAGIPIMEGYGLTETSPVLCVNTLDNLKFGTVGKPARGVKISIAEDGEVLARGDNVMQGYYKMPEETDKAIKDGWFQTGDIGHIDDDGYLVITDRKKDIIVTAGGKNVAPQPVEHRVKQSPFIDEVVVVGNRRKFLAAVIVPNFAKLDEFAASAGIPLPATESLTLSAEVADLYQREIEGMCADLAPFEQPKKSIVLNQELSVGTGELTPTLKVKRRVIEERYKAEIDALYQD